MRNMLRAGLLAGAVALAMPSAAAFAHHSFAMFDQTKLVTMTGTVKQFDWTAPHAMLWFIEDPKPGQAAGDTDARLWSIELSTSPGPLSRLGWTKHSLQPGDKIAVDINPLRSGDPGGSFKKAVVVKTGQVLVTTPPGQDTAPAATPAADKPATDKP